MKGASQVRAEKVQGTDLSHFENDFKLMFWLAVVPQGAIHHSGQRHGGFQGSRQAWLWLSTSRQIRKARVEEAGTQHALSTSLSSSLGQQPSEWWLMQLS